MKKINHHQLVQTMNEIRIKKIVFLSIAFFFLSIMAVALHRHNNPILPPVCSICKVKTSLSGTFSKIKTDSAPAVAVFYLPLAAVCMSMSGILRNTKTFFINSKTAVAYPNKASPFAF
jgi:hypothetical protein